MTLRLSSLLLAICLAAPAAAQPGAGSDAQSWLRVDWPPPEGTTVSASLVEVRGHAGARGLRGHEVVIVLDLSDSTLQPSGVDLDGDAAQGRSDPGFVARLAAEPGVPDGLPARLQESDFEDSVLSAELAAAEALLQRLDPRVFRVGIVVFSDGARVLAPVGSSPARLRQALEKVRLRFFEDLRGTHFAEAVSVAHRAMVPAPPPAPVRPKRWWRADPPPPPPPPALPDRERSILFLSDGTPTLPVHGQRAAEHALAATRAAAADGVRLYAFALGPEASEALPVYQEMAALSGGRFERVERPGDVPARLRRVDLADLEELRIENRTTGQLARAQRTLPDGSFDAFVVLEPGENQLVFRARASDGSVRSLERSVRLEEEAEQDAVASRAQREALLEELRRRTRETELWAEIERGRRHVIRELELRPVPAPADPAAAPPP